MASMVVYELNVKWDVKMLKLEISRNLQSALWISKARVTKTES
jgi:hypothetical protein